MTDTLSPTEGLVPLVLVPVEVFGAEDGYGLCDAVSAWSDCNRAIGQVYRVDDLAQYRNPGEAITIYVKQEDIEWFKRKWGNDD